MADDIVMICINIEELKDNMEKFINLQGKKP